MSFSVDPRNEARKVFAYSGISYADLQRADFERLRDTIDRLLANAATIKGYKMRREIRLVNWPNGWAALTCQAYYFESREAVTFNDNGFIGFAGWADDGNAVPILEGFKEWVAETAKQKAAERALMMEAGRA